MRRYIILTGIGLIALLIAGTGAQASPSTLGTGSLDEGYLLQPLAGPDGLIPDWQARWELARALSYVKQYPDSIKEYERLLAVRPDLTDARLEMAHVLTWMGNPDRAIRMFEEIPDDQRDDRTRLAMADIYAGRKKYPEALALFQRYLTANPGDHQARVRLAEVLSWTGQYPEALVQYRQVLAQIPDDIQVRRKYAFVLIWSNQHEAAITELRKTLPP